MPGRARERLGRARERHGALGGARGAPGKRRGSAGGAVAGGAPRGGAAEAFETNGAEFKNLVQEGRGGQADKETVGGYMRQSRNVTDQRHEWKDP